MTLKTRLRDVLASGGDGELDELMAAEPGAARHALGLTYHADEAIRAKAVRGVALAARHHPELVQEMMRRLVWAMNDESGTNAESAPAVIAAVAGENPGLLVPLVPALVRLSTDPALHDGIAAALRTVAQRCPGEVGSRIAEALNEWLTSCSCVRSDNG